MPLPSQDQFIQVQWLSSEKETFLFEKPTLLVMWRHGHAARGQPNEVRLQLAQCGRFGFEPSMQPAQLFQNVFDVQ